MLQSLDHVINQQLAWDCPRAILCLYQFILSILLIFHDSDPVQVNEFIIQEV